MKGAMQLATMMAQDPGKAVERVESVEERRERLWDQCSGLAQEPDILSRVEAVLPHTGYVGESKTPLNLYLGITSRCQPRPISTLIQGPSSAGKSFMLGCVLKLFPPAASHEIPSVSPKARAYGQEPIANRIIGLAEAQENVRQ